MALDFGGSMFGGEKGALSSDYKSAGSHQKEIRLFLEVADTNWHLIHTVTTGKTLYISKIIFTTNASGIKTLGTGAPTAVLSMYTANSVVVDLQVPMVFTSETTVHVMGSNMTQFALIGWEE